MTYQQVRDVVKTMRESHQQLRDALERPRSQSHDTRTRMMLEALRREEQDLQLTLGRYGEKGRDALLDTWLQFVPDEDILQTLAAIEFSPEMSAEEVVARKLEFDQALIELLRQLRGETAVPRVQEFFSLLLENIESRASQQVWSIREYQADAEPPSPD